MIEVAEIGDGTKTPYHITFLGFSWDTGERMYLFRKTDEIPTCGKKFFLKFFVGLLFCVFAARKYPASLSPSGCLTRAKPNSIEGDSGKNWPQGRSSVL